MRYIKLLLLFALLVLFTTAVVGYLGYQDLRRPRTHNAAEEVITIEPGMGRRAIIDRLVQVGIIENRWPVLVYLALNPQSRKLQAGDYRFESPITPIAALAKIEQGQITTEQVTIPEGYDKFDILETLVKTGIDSREAFQKAIKDTSLIADLDPEARDLEGYLFPDTYSYTRQTRAPQLIAAMVRRCRQVLTPARLEQARVLGFNTHQLMTMASLVEREAKVDDERPLISAVFHNRLKRGMRLDCDPTFIYAAKVEGVWDNNVNNPLHRKRESPYNTYFVVGMPPGPIASPGMKSIDAALSPTPADYLYFVVQGSDGRHKFSSTEAEHLAAVAEYRRQQRQGRN
jgi:UPF0755 protein